MLAGHLTLYDNDLSMQGWLDETAESLKSLDHNHLVTYSSEGFLGSSTPGEVPADAWPSARSCAAP